MEAKVATYQWWSIVLDVNYKLDWTTSSDFLSVGNMTVP